MDAREVLRAKRDGRELSADEIGSFITGYVAGEVPEYQASALLMAIFVHGMAPEELFEWTGAMLRSGAVYDLADIAGPKVDKHSTGGVGDKVSIPLAPAVAACGARVPMVSGRGLGHTAGTLDKLEAIPGFRTDLSQAEYRAALEHTGVAFAGQTAELVPADRKLYALRDATGLVESIPLIASSILSKKLAEGIGGLVLDVKFGSGAFLPEVERGRELAETMLAIARRFELPATAFQTSMEEPLGCTIGHALEIEESLACLAGKGPSDLRRLVTTFGGEMLVQAGLAAEGEEGNALIGAALDDGRALAVFERIVREQGGDPRCVSDASHLPRAPDVELHRADRAGTLDVANCRALGEALAVLGGGRAQLGEALDPAVGLVLLCKAGGEVARDEPLVEIHHRAGHGLERARALIAKALTIGETRERPPLVLDRLT